MGKRYADSAGDGKADPATIQCEEIVAAAVCEQIGKLSRTDQPFIHDDGIRRQGIRDLQHDSFGVECRPRFPGEDRLGDPRPVGAPVSGFDFPEALVSGSGLGVAPVLLDVCEQCPESRFDIRADGHFSGIILAHFPIVLTDMDESRAFGHGLHGGIDRHPEDIAAKCDHHIVVGKDLTDLFLHASQATDVGWVFGKIMRARWY